MRGDFQKQFRAKMPLFSAVVFNLSFTAYLHNDKISRTKLFAIFVCDLLIAREIVFESRRSTADKDEGCLVPALPLSSFHMG